MNPLTTTLQELTFLKTKLIAKPNKQELFILYAYTTA